MWTSAFELISFVFCLLFCFYLPGRFFLSRLKLKFSSLEQLFLSLVCGILVFLLLFYILSWLHLEILAIGFYAVIDFLAIKQRTFPWQRIERKDVFPFGLLCLFSILFSTPLLLAGIYGNRVAYGFDDMWHIALMREMAFRFPPHIPTYAGVALSGYHFFYDFLLAKISQFFAISPFSLHFHFFSLLLAILWGIGVYVLLHLWTNNRATSLFGVFLSMFGGSFAYFYLLTGHPQVSQSDGLGIMQPAFSIYNPPFSLSIIFIIFALISLYHYLQERTKTYLFLLILAAGLLPMTKIYAAMVFYSGFGIVALVELLRKRFSTLFALLLVGAMFLLTYGVFVGGQGGLIWFPLWAPIGILRAFTWYNYDNKIYVYSHQGVIHGLVETFAYGLWVFLVLNLGTRILGILLLPVTYFTKSAKTKTPLLFSISLLVMLLTSIFIPLFFIQTGKVFEIIQLGFYYLFFCSLFAAVGFGIIFSLRFRFALIVQIILVSLLIGLTIDSSYFIYRGLFAHPSQKQELMSSPYHQALSFLQRRGRYDQTVLELPMDAIGANLYGMDYWYGISMPAVTAFANKQTFWASTGIDFKGMNTKSRMNDLLVVLQYRKDASTQHMQNVEKLLQKDTIHYIFSPYSFDSLLKIKGMRKIYDREYVIYEIL